MNTIDYPEEIDRLREFFKKNTGMKEISEHYSHEHFGNVILSIADDIVEAQIVRDRGIWSIDINPAKQRDNYWHISFWWELIHGEAHDGPVSLQEEVDFFCTNWHFIEKSLSPDMIDDTMCEMERIAEQIKKRWFPGSGGGPANG